ncbi:NRDE-2, necessary for RNA interference-domain-containing protein [Cokeromyces recurvatus]|uniref:NRDE-2, necessary for RNA interference-domain-containing protein n=1 Tax=Cokeromyces recurvatus TaxID=90255 RepID=UPI0022202498|nr:NRDE-2, necessary for RNA interference-domain-containing protein [Cokeromyces recurvatus]KAI7908306.1 NRDE-2, necessary for RNA interference-domain-containing protein [Cokeromyces recurvatus]
MQSFNSTNKKNIPPSPSFSSAPDINAKIPVPSFSSAPDFSFKDDKYKSHNDTTNNNNNIRRHHRHRSSSRRDRPRSSSPSQRRRHRSRSPKHHSARHRSRSPQSRHERKSSKRSKRTPSPEIIHTGTLNTGITFTMDRRGDPDIITYGGNHAYSVPIFKRCGGGRVIGLSPNIRIDNSVVKSGQISIIDIWDKKKTSRYIDPDYSWKEFDKDLKRIHIQPEKNTSDPFALHTNIITLEDRQSRLQSNDDDYNISGVDYRSLEGNKVRHADQQEDIEQLREEGESFNDYIRQRTIDFNRQLDKEPENVQLWLDFIHFQDEAATSLDPNAPKSNKSSLSEIKLNIFEKALESNPMDEELLLAYLTCGAESWENLKLLREWDRVLKEHPSSIRLWSEYINLRQTNFASFSYTQCVQVFADAISVLSRQLQQQQYRDEDERREDIESLMVYILLRACLFMKQAGYQERAFAIIQAIVEFNLFQPHILNMTDDNNKTKLNAFTDFWDSEVLRFGEEGARGWHDYYRATQNGEEVPEPVFNKPIDQNQKEQEEDEVMDLNEWISSELCKEEKERLPLRMNQVEDESVDEDPYRIILSDDVKPFLFNITHMEARQSLIYSLFVFLGLPFTPPDIGTNTHFYTDIFTHNELNLAHFWPAKENTRKHLVWYVAGVPMTPEEITMESNPYYIPNSYPVRVPELFAKYGTWFKCSGKEFIHCQIDEKFTRTIFKQLLAVEKSEQLMIYYLAFESSCGYKFGRQLAKNLLKDQRTSLTLWNAYAQMEKSHDHINESRKVYLTALSMYHTFPKDEQESLPLLYYMFAKLELENNKPNEALKILVSMSDSVPYNAAMPLPSTPLILRAREYFSQKLAQLSTLSESYRERQNALNMISCAALFEYLSSGLDSACSIYEHALEYIKERQAERGYASEAIWIEYAGLLYYHFTTEKMYKPRVLRYAMERALSLFPNNTIFLAFYIWNESKTKIYNRVQHLLNDALNKNSNVILWLSAIYNELHKYKPYHVDSVRDYFERSIQDTRTRSSIILWKCYIQFEISQNNIEKALRLFYRSVRECPWSKELYLLGLQSFSKVMNEKELNELVSLMMEKEIRLRTPIEDDLLNQ